MEVKVEYFGISPVYRMMEGNTLSICFKQPVIDQQRLTVEICGLNDFEPDSLWALNDLIHDTYNTTIGLYYDILMKIFRDIYYGHWDVNGKSVKEVRFTFKENMVDFKVPSFSNLIMCLAKYEEQIRNWLKAIISQYSSKIQYPLPVAVYNSPNSDKNNVMIGEISICTGMQKKAFVNTFKYGSQVATAKNPVFWASFFMKNYYENGDEDTKKQIEEVLEDATMVECFSSETGTHEIGKKVKGKWVFSYQ